MFIWILMWIIGAFAGTGVYGSIGDDSAYQAGGTGTFGIPNEVLRTLYSLGVGAIPLILKYFFPKYWPVISKILELLKIKKEPTQSTTADTKLKEAQEALSVLAGVCAEYNCKEAIGKVGDLFTHIHELFLKEKNEQEAIKPEAK